MVQPTEVLIYCLLMPLKSKEAFFAMSIN